MLIATTWQLDNFAHHFGDFWSAVHAVLSSSTAYKRMLSCLHCFQFPFNTQNATKRWNAFLMLLRLFCIYAKCVTMALCLPSPCLSSFDFFAVAQHTFAWTNWSGFLFERVFLLWCGYVVFVFAVRFVFIFIRCLNSVESSALSTKTYVTSIKLFCE